MTQPIREANHDSAQQQRDNEERRQHARYNRGNLELSVARPGIKGILRINPSSSNCLDISLSGIQFNSNQKFALNEKLVLDLCVNEFSLTELNAIVLDSQQEEGEWCTRAKFCFEAKRMQKPAVTTNLLKIIDRLRTEHEFPLTTPYSSQ